VEKEAKTRKCTRCRINYPSELVQTMVSSIGNFALCGICYLDFSNELHGIKRRSLDGTVAEGLRQKAIAFRKEHNLDYFGPK